MKKFDYMEFEGGYQKEIVFDADRYSQEEALAIVDSYYADMAVLDIKKRFVKFFVNAPYCCGYIEKGGCYSYCNEGDRGSFPVWSIGTTMRTSDQKEDV